MHGRLCWLPEAPSDTRRAPPTPSLAGGALGAPRWAVQRQDAAGQADAPFRGVVWLDCQILHRGIRFVWAGRASRSRPYPAFLSTLQLVTCSPRVCLNFAPITALVMQSSNSHSSILPGLLDRFPIVQYSVFQIGSACTCTCYALLCFRPIDRLKLDLPVVVCISVSPCLRCMASCMFVLPVSVCVPGLDSRS